MANRYWVGGSGTWDTTTTTHWSTTSGGSGGASVPTAADSVFFDQASTYTVTMTGALVCLDFTVSAGVVTFATGTNPTIAISGNVSLIAATVWTSTGAITFNAASLVAISTNGVVLGANTQFNNASGTFQLQSAFAVRQLSTALLTAGTLDLNGFTLTAGVFSSNNTNTRTLAFGTGNITVNGTGTVWTTATITGLTVTGTPIVNVSNSTATATTITPGALTEANSISFNVTTGTYTLTVTSTGAVKNMIFTGFAGTVANTAVTIYGNLTLSTGMTLTAGTNAWTFSATTTKTITSNGKTMDFPVTFDGVGGAWLLADAATIGSTRTTTLTNGSLYLNDKTYTTGLFSSSNSNSRGIIFGAGNITVNGTGLVWNTATTTNLYISAAVSPTVNVSNATATATTVTPGSLSEANAISFNFTTGTYALTMTASSSWGSLNFTGFGGSVGNTAQTIYGSLTLAAGATYTAGANTWTFAPTFGSKTITSNGKTIDWPVIFGFSASTATWQLQDNMLVGTTRTTTLATGTVDLNGKSLTTGLFSSPNGTTRGITFGAGGLINATATSNAGVDFTVATNLTLTGTPVFYCSNATAAGVAMGHAGQGWFTEANALPVVIGTPGVGASGIYLANAGNVNVQGYVGTVNLTGSTGILVGNTAKTIYGNLTIASGMTVGASTVAITFGATSGTKTITTNGKTVDAPITFNGVGGTWQLQDALTMGSTRTLTQTNGTLDLNGKTLTTGTYTTAAGTKNLTFNAGTLVISGSGTSLNNAVPTGFTTTAGTGVGVISMTSATAKSIQGGGSTYNCTLNQGGAGALTINGTNTWSNITNTVRPTTVTFPASTTNTFTNFSLSGTAGNLVTINCTSAGTQATVSKSSGTVSCDYLSIKDSAATGGATWNAGANSTNVSNNTGWIFTAPPGGTGNFFTFLTN